MATNDDGRPGGGKFPAVVHALKQAFDPDNGYWASERLVLIYLVFKMGFNPQTQQFSCYFGGERIAEDTGYSVRTVRRVIEHHRNSPHPLVAFSSRGHRMSLLSTLIRDPVAFVAAREQARIASAAAHQAHADRKAGKRLKAAIAKLPVPSLNAMPQRPISIRMAAGSSIFECGCGSVVIQVDGMTRDYNLSAGRAGGPHSCHPVACHAGTLIQATR
jgi:hypothetical protein